MARVRVVSRADGGVSVIRVAPAFAALPDETEDQRLDRAFTLIVQKTPILQGRPTHDQDDSTLPPRRFRNAWRKQLSSVDIDVTQARSLRAEELAREAEQRRSRAVRERAKARGAKKLGWRAHLDALDAIEFDLDALTTPESLAAFNPAWPADPA